MTAIELGTLNLGEHHPVTQRAVNWIFSLGTKKMFMSLEAFQSCAENNRCAEVCGETLRRLLHREPVSDRYVLGLAWALKELEDNIEE